MTNQWVGIKQVFLSLKKYSELLKTESDNIVFCSV